MGRKILVLAVVALLAAGGAVAVAAGDQAQIDCTIKTNLLTCPLPAPPAPVTNTETITQQSAVASTDTATVPAAPETLFGDAVPAIPAQADNKAVELGVRFKPAIDGVVTGVRFYKSVGNTGTHTGSLWSGTVRAATVTFTGETDSGWQTATFATPVVVNADAEYVASYLAPVGKYAGDGGHTWPKISGNLTGLGSVYKYGGGSPTEDYNDSNYYVDVLFIPTGKGRTGTSETKPDSTSAPIAAQSSTASETMTTQRAVGACVGTANAPGGADPWGGCWPGPQNTGYPKGLPGDSRTPVTLTPYTGPKVITSCGVVIDSMSTSWLVINASNGTHSPDTPCVTIKNSYVKGTVTNFGNSNYGPVVIQDTEIDSDGDLPYAENAGRYNFFTYRVNSHGGQAVIKCAGWCETKDNWVHGMRLGQSYHYNAIGGNGMEGGSWLIEHNWTECGHWESVAPDIGAAGCSSDIGFYGDYAPIRNITVNKNYLAGMDEAVARDHPVPYCIQSGYSPGKAYPTPTAMTFTNNVFGRGTSGKCGLYGPVTTLGPGENIVWANNAYEDGVQIPRP